MTDRIADIWGTRTPRARGESWPVRVDEHLEEGVDPQAVTWFQSARVLCSNGCGMDVAVATAASSACAGAPTTGPSRSK